MSVALLDLPAHARGSIAKALSAGYLTEPYTAAALGSVCGVKGEGAAIAVAELDRLAALGIKAAAAAAFIEAVELAARRPSQPDFVWSGPEAPGLHARDTREVFRELLETAEHSIWASTYAFFDGQKAFETLALRMDAVPTLEVRLLLNIHRKYNDDTPAEQLVRAFADRFWKKEWPGQRRPAVFFDPRSVDIPPAGVLHAKAIVADEHSVLITSANFTEAALDKNIEMGILLRDGALAQTVVRHFSALIDQGFVKPMPAQ